MPWRESSVVEERIRFVVLASHGERKFGELCSEFGISRQTGYTWLKRYAAGGSEEMEDRSRRPHLSPGKIESTTEERIVGLRQRWPDWGAPKLQVLLMSNYPDEKPITVRTVHRVLERNGLLGERYRHRPATKRFERKAPNELWQMDFKGPQGFNTGSPVGPLSIVDDHSRYLITLQNLGSTKLEGVRDTMRQTFETAGVPDSLLIDHGTPWWNSNSAWGLTELTVWIMQQGVRLLFSGIRHPQTQGKVERMHGSLQRAVRDREANPDDQQWLDLFRHEYNYLRPHAALAMATPSTRWRPSERKYDPNPPAWKYAASMDVAQVDSRGSMNWAGRGWVISRALRGQSVGIEVVGDRAIVFYCNTPMRELDLTMRTSYAIPVDLPKNLSDVRGNCPRPKA